MAMRILVTGASGLLGSKVAETAMRLGHEVYSGYLTSEPMLGVPLRFDVRDEASLRKAFDIARPYVVIHTAAITDVDKCEMERELAWRVNVEGTRNVARLSYEYGAFLIYVSTDYVFRGDRGMYREDDETGPINYYGYTKLEGEKIVRELDESCIARTSAIYGASQVGKPNFALWVIQKLRRQERIAVVTDQWVSPTLNTNLSEMIMEIAERRLGGVYHLAGATRISRYDFSKLIAEIFELKGELIMPTKMENMGWAANRPRDSSLDVSKAMRELRNKPKEIREALRDLREEFRALNLDIPRV